MKNFIFTFIFFIAYSFSCLASPLYSAQISVDITDQTVSLAKSKAISQATRDGLNEILSSITTQQAIDEISKLNDNQIQHFIESIQILMEKSSNVRYIADIKVDVNENVLKSYLTENNFPIIITAQKNILLIPLVEYTDSTLDLWGSDNILRNELLEKTNLHSNHIKFHVIEKNLGNISSVDASSIYNMDDQKYDELISFNQKDYITVLKYSLKDNKIYAKTFPQKTIIEEQITPTDTPSSLIAKVLPIVKMDSKNIPSSTSNTTSSSDINIIYTYPNLSSWVNLKKLLEQNPLVNNLKIISITNKKIHFSFTYNDAIEKLQSSLMINGYNLKDNGDYYVIN